jgi:hypothetical protein
LGGFIGKPGLTGPPPGGRGDYNKGGWLSDEEKGIRGPKWLINKGGPFGKYGGPTGAEIDGTEVTTPAGKIAKLVDEWYQNIYNQGFFPTHAKHGGTAWDPRMGSLGGTANPWFMPATTPTETMSKTKEVKRQGGEGGCDPASPPGT